MVRSRRNLLTVIATLGFALGMPAAAPKDAFAQSKLDAYRANGTLAERYDGYVEVRDPQAPRDARALADEVNAQRRELYGKRGRETGVSAAQVGKVFAAKILEQAPRGTYFRQDSGGYMRK